MVFMDLKAIAFAIVLLLGVSEAAVSQGQVILVQRAGPGAGGGGDPQSSQQEEEPKKREKQNAKEQQQQLEQKRRAQEDQQRKLQEQQKQLEQQRRQAQEQQKLKAQEDQQRKLQEQQRKHAQEEQQRKLQEQQKQLEQQRRQAQEQQKLKAQEDQQRKLQEQQRKQAQEEQQRKLQEQQKQLEQQRRQAQEQLKLQEQQKLKAQDEQQRKLQEQQKKQAQEEQQRKLQDQQKQLEQQRRQAQEQLKLQEQQKLKAQDEQQRKLEDLKKAQEQQRLLKDQKPVDQRKLLEEGRQVGDEARKKAMEEARRREIERNRLLAAELEKGRAEREGRRRQLQLMVERQKQLAQREKRPEQLTERLKLENERLGALRERRKITVDPGGQKLIHEPGNRIIIQNNNQVFIRHNEVERFRRFGGRDFRSVPGREGSTITTYTRPDGARIEIEVDSYGRPLRRVRHYPDGRRHVLFENKRLAVGLGLAAAASAFIVDLPPLQETPPPDEYIVEAGEASEEDIYNALYSDPVEPLPRSYTLDEVLASYSLRQRMRSVNINSINFAFGSWEIQPDQATALEEVAVVMKDIIRRNPGEMFLIEGHTDAVGSEVDNVSLSDRRAEAVATALTQQFEVPAENLVTQGYGEQFLLVQTEEPEWRNRRVVIRRITPLLGASQSE